MRALRSLVLAAALAAVACADVPTLNVAWTSSKPYTNAYFEAMKRAGPLVVAAGQTYEEGRIVGLRATDGTVLFNSTMAPEAIYSNRGVAGSASYCAFLPSTSRVSVVDAATGNATWSWLLDAGVAVDSLALGPQQMASEVVLASVTNNGLYIVINGRPSAVVSGRFGGPANGTATSVAVSNNGNKVLAVTYPAGGGLEYVAFDQSGRRLWSVHVATGPFHVYPTIAAFDDGFVAWTEYDVVQINSAGRVVSNISVLGTDVIIQDVAVSRTSFVVLTVTRASPRGGASVARAAAGGIQGALRRAKQRAQATANSAASIKVYDVTGRLQWTKSVASATENVAIGEDTGRVIVTCVKESCSMLDGQKGSTLAEFPDYLLEAGPAVIVGDMVAVWGSTSQENIFGLQIPRSGNQTTTAPKL